MISMQSIMVGVLSICIIIALIVIGFFILVLLGNLVAMKFLAKSGLAVFSHNIVKDSKLLNYVNKEGACWLSIPDVCYSPVMYDCNGKYKDHNFLQKENRFGELYVSEDSKSQKLLELGIKNKYKIPDLTIIKGDYRGVGTNLRHLNFSQLRKMNTKIRDKSSITLCENGVVRTFIPFGVIDVSLSEKHSFKYNSRQEFIDSFLEHSKYKGSVSDFNKSILILECKTEIDVVLVMLIEKEG